jgi:hypothetical protein
MSPYSTQIFDEISDLYTTVSQFLLEYFKRDQYKNESAQDSCAFIDRADGQAKE